MGKLENLEAGDKFLYSDKYFSGDYNQELYIKRSEDDGSNKPKYFINAYSNINGEVVRQGYIYFYLDESTKTSSFIGVKVEEAYRDLNIGSFLIASWINLCLNNGYDFLGINQKQRKPFLLYLLKTYGFEILDTSLYYTRPDVITICKSEDQRDRTKYLLFRDAQHEKTFIGTNIFKTDNYETVHNQHGLIILDHIILPLQNMKKNPIEYELLNYDLAESKVESVISKHTR